MVQREDPHIREGAQPARQGPSWEESLEVFKALSDILQVGPHHAVIYEEVPEGLVRPTGFPADYAGGVASAYMPLLNEWYVAARGGSFVEVGPPHLIRGEDLLEHVQRAIAHTRPFVRALKAEGDDATVP